MGELARGSATLALLCPLLLRPTRAARHPGWLRSLIPRGFRYLIGDPLHHCLFGQNLTVRTLEILRPFWISRNFRRTNWLLLHRRSFLTCGLSPRTLVTTTFGPSRSAGVSILSVCNGYPARATHKPYGHCLVIGSNPVAPIKVARLLSSSTSKNQVHGPCRTDRRRSAHHLVSVPPTGSTDWCWKSTPRRGPVRS